MAEGRERSEWRRISHFMALVAKMLCDPKHAKEIEPKNFDITWDENKKKPPVADISVLKEIFCKEN